MVQLQLAGDPAQHGVVRFAVFQPADLLEPGVQQGAAIERLPPLQSQLLGQVHATAPFQPRRAAVIQPARRLRRPLRQTTSAAAKPLSPPAAAGRLPHLSSNQSASPCS